MITDNNVLLLKEKQCCKWKPFVYFRVYNSWIVFFFIVIKWIKRKKNDAFLYVQHMKEERRKIKLQYKKKGRGYQ